MNSSHADEFPQRQAADTTAPDAGQAGPRVGPSKGGAATAGPRESQDSQRREGLGIRASFSCQELDTFSESGTTTGKSTALEPPAQTCWTVTQKSCWGVSHETSRRSAEMGQSDSGKFSATKVKKVGLVSWC